MRLSTSEGTTNIITGGITWMRQDKYAAMPASFQEGAKLRVNPDRQSQRQIISSCQASNLWSTKPTRNELKKELQLYDKKLDI